MLTHHHKYMSPRRKDGFDSASLANDLEKRGGARLTSPPRVHGRVIRPRRPESLNLLVTILGRSRWSFGELYSGDPGPALRLKKHASVGLGGSWLRMEPTRRVSRRSAS